MAVWLTTKNSARPHVENAVNDENVTADGAVVATAAAGSLVNALLINGDEIVSEAVGVEAPARGGAGRVAKPAP